MSSIATRTRNKLKKSKGKMDIETPLIKVKPTQKNQSRAQIKNFLDNIHEEPDLKAYMTSDDDPI